MSNYSETVSQPSHSAHTGISGITILLVEQDACVRNSITRFLALNGFNIVAAEDVHTARAIWATHKSDIDLLLADVAMPNDVRGQRLAMEFQNERPDLKVLYTSEHDAEALNPEQASGEVHFIQKPYRPEHLLAAIDSVFANNFEVHTETLC